MRRDLTPIKRAYVTIEDGAQLHYRQAGTAGAPTLVLLHQTPSTSQMYEPLMQALAHDFELIAFDTPGFGQSDALPGVLTIPAAAQRLAQAFTRLQIGPAFWFGHHTGAALALQLASDHPGLVSALAMSGPCLLDERLRERLPQIAAPISAVLSGEHLQTLWDRMVAKDAEASLAILQRETCAGLMASEAYPQAYRAVVELDTAAQLQALDCPCLVFSGTEDPLYPQLDAAYALLKDGQRAEIVGAKTFVCERQSAEVADLLRSFCGALNV